MARRRTLARRERVVCGAPFDGRVAAQACELVGGVGRRRADRGEERDEADGGGDRAGGEKGRRPRPSEHGKDEKSDRKGDERRARVRPEEPGVHDRPGSDRPASRPHRGEQEQHDDQRIRRRERAQEGRDEAASRALLVRVENPVLGEPREAPVGEPELLGEPVGDTGVAPPVERDEVHVDEPPGREADADADERQADPAPPGAVEHDESAEDVRAERQEVVAQRVELASPRRVAAEPGLGCDGVHDDEPAVGERETVGPEELRDRPCGEREHERGEQQDVLPGGHCVEGGVTDARLPEERHREVVQHEPDDEDEQRDTGETRGHAIATSVRPRLRISTGPGKSALRSDGPSNRFSRAHDFPARS